MAALAKAAKADDFPAEIALVISNRPHAEGLKRAETLGIQAMAIDHKHFKTRVAFDAALTAVLQEARIELICCAGFMRVLTSEFTAQWAGRIINIHPSLLPKYKGLNTHARALKAGDEHHGASVHWVSEDLDSGEVIKQSALSIAAKDTPDSLASRVLALELRLYPCALKQVATHWKQPRI
jgi:phosphoribosylglycinamide formyltransferase-1